MRLVPANPTRTRGGVCRVLLCVAGTFLSGAALLVLVASHAAAQNLSFAPAVSIDVGDSPIGVAVDDVNGDQLLDLVTANNGGVDEGSASLLLGRADGGFEAAVDIAAGSGPLDVVLADMNNDTFADILVADELASTVVVLLNDGNGNFGAGMSAATGESPAALAVGHLDADGNADVVTADSFDDSLSVFRGQGDGSLTTPEAILVSIEPVDVALGDLDGDGHLDIVAVNIAGGPDEFGSLSVIPGEEGGGFSFPFEIASTTFDTPVNVAIAPIDGDALPDLVVVNEDGDQISVLLNAGNFGFQLPEDFDPPLTAGVGFFPKEAAVGDFNGDGAADVATSNNFDDNVTVLLGDGSGRFEPGGAYEVGAGPWGIAAADVNGDGLLDIVTTDLDDSTVSILRNTSTEAPECVGDCTLDSEVTVDEILTMVNIALGQAMPDTCEAGDANGDGEVTVDEILQAVTNALEGCPQ